MNKKQYLIIGASGYISSNLIKHLDYKKIPYKALSLSISNNNVYRSDKLSIDQLDKVFQNSHTIIYCAGYSKNDSCNQKKNSEINYLKRIINFTIKNKIKKFIYLSSSKLNHNYYNNLYTSNKSLIEDIIHKSFFNYHINYVILRLSPVFGLGHKSTIYKLNKLISFLPLAIVPDLYTKKSFIYISDLVQTLLLISKKNLQKNLYNLSYTEPITIKELFFKLNQNFSKKITFIIPSLLINIILNFLSIIIGRKYVFFFLNDEINNSNDLFTELNWFPTYSFNRALKKGNI